MGAVRTKMGWFCSKVPQKWERSEQKRGGIVLRNLKMGAIRTKMGVLCAEEGVLRDAQNKKWSFCAEGGVFEGCQNKKWGVLY